MEESPTSAAASSKADYLGDDIEKRQEKRTKEERAVLLEGTRFKFALLSTTILLFTLYLFLLLLFLCPGVEFTAEEAQPPPQSFIPLVSPQESDSAPTFRRIITALAVITSTSFVLHHLVRSITFSACLVFVSINCSVWLVCITWGPVSELLGGLVHMPVLAFYVFGHRSGVGTLFITLVQVVLYTGACMVGFVPMSGNTLKLGLTAQMTAVMGTYVLLGLCAALNERSRMQAVRLYKAAHVRLARTTQAKARFLVNVSHGTVRIYLTKLLLQLMSCRFPNSPPEELRTPLHGIVAASEELSERIEAECTDSRPALRDMCNIVVESSDHMLALVNDVLDFEQMDTNQLKIEHIPFHLDKEFTKLLKVVHSFPSSIILTSVCHVPRCWSQRRN
jgi:hypothetical protein